MTPLSTQSRTWAITSATNLHARFDPRHNHLNAMRLVLAITVAVCHGMELGFGHQPTISGVELGDLAVDAFFVLSGFLLAGSYLRLDSIRRYVWHRFLRIMPGFWVCLAVTALIVAPAIAAIQGRGAASVFTGDESAFHFILRDSTLMMRQFGINGLPQDVPAPGILNGSLWTLFYEAICYATVIGLGLVGALRRRPALTLAVIGMLWILTVLHAGEFVIIGPERVLRFTFLFLIGSAMFLYARVMPMTAWFAAASAVVLIAGLVWTPDYRAVAAPALAYLCLWFAVIRPPKATASSDFSYGLYVYHWPIFQLLAVAGLAESGHPVFIITGLILALSAALLSWYLIERPCLTFKNAAWIYPGGVRSRPTAMGG
jgi:peptidoglycan/LPS O-acetylase OafA/YrhL